MRSLSGTGFWEVCLKEIMTKLGSFPRRNHTDQGTEAETSSWGDEQQLGVTVVKGKERGREWLKMKKQRIQTSTEEETKEGDVLVQVRDGEGYKVGKRRGWRGF